MSEGNPHRTERQLTPSTTTVSGRARSHRSPAVSEASTPPESCECSASQTLRDARETVESLRTHRGPYYVACRETGARPEPVTDATFADLSDATAARQAARRYRDALSSLDPSCSRYDLGVYETDDHAVTVARVRETTAERRENGLPAATQSVLLAGAGPDEWLRMENGPVVHVVGRGSLLDDEVIARQIDVKL